MNDTAQILMATGTVITAIGTLTTLILGILNRQTIRSVQSQTDGIMNVMRADMRESGRLAGVAESQTSHAEAAALVAAAEPTKVEIVKVPPLKL